MIFGFPLVADHTHVDTGCLTHCQGDTPRGYTATLLCGAFQLLSKEKMTQGVYMVLIVYCCCTVKGAQDAKAQVLRRDAEVMGTR